MDALPGGGALALLLLLVCACAAREVPLSPSGAPLWGPRTKPAPAPFPVQGRAAQPAADAASIPLPEPAPGLADQPATGSVVNSFQSGGGPVENPAVGSAGDPVGKPMLSPAGRALGNPVLGAACQPVDEAVGNPAPESVDQPVGRAMGNPGLVSVGQPAFRAAGNPASGSAGLPLGGAAGNIPLTPAGQPVGGAVGNPSPGSVGQPLGGAAGNPPLGPAAQPVDSEDAGAWANDEDAFAPNATRDFNAFEWALCTSVARGAGSVTVSPVGVRLVLALMGEAATGAAARELRHALALPRVPSRARAYVARLLRALKQKGDGYIMDVGNRIYLDDHYKPNRTIKQILQRRYDATIEKINFDNPEIARNDINSWVSNFTHGRIANLITNNDQIKDTISLILNVIFFKGKWLYPFPKNDTLRDVFYKSHNETVITDYMRQTADFFYLDSEALKAKILRLPYEGKKYAAFIILPNHPDNFEAMLQSINPTVVRAELLKMEKYEIDVKLPKIKIDSTLQLKEILQKIGITRIFNVSEEINLTVNKTNLMISQVFQKVALEVNEEGTVAAMGTGSGLANTFGGRLEFKATHPFMFFVEEEKTGTVLFVGKVVDPTQAQSIVGGAQTENVDSHTPRGINNRRISVRDPTRTIPGIPQRSPE